VQTLTLKEAAEACGLSVKALQRRAERGTLRVVVRDGVRRLPLSELERAGLLPDAEVRGLRDELARLERELATHRLLVERVERETAVEVEARQRAEAAAVEARAGERQARDELTELARMGWRARRRRLRELRASKPA
jgi:hypothetical protein